MFRLKQCFLVFLILIFGKKLSSQDLNVSLDQDLSEHYNVSGLPGFALAVIQEGKVVFRGSYGFADIENQIPFTTATILNIGSVSKTVVGVAMAQCLARDYFVLDSEISKFLPFDISYPKTQADIAIHHLGTHTSGLKDTKYYGHTYVPLKSDDEDVHQGFRSFLERHDEIPLSVFLANLYSKGGKWYSRKNFSKRGPGMDFEYANVNAAIGALVVESVSDLSFHEFTTKHIFQPLHMNSTSWDHPTEMATRYFPSGEKVPAYRLITYPDGGLYSSVEDLSRFVLDILKARKGEDTEMDPMDVKALLPGDEDDNRIFWGMGEKSRDIGHAGSDPGVQVDLRFNADHSTGIIVMTNVNAEDDSSLSEQFSNIIQLVKKYYYSDN